MNNSDSIQLYDIISQEVIVILSEILKTEKTDRKRNPI